jgi:THO complex subunit 3
MSTELRGHTAPVAALAWDPTHSDRLASCGSDKTVRFWDYRTKSCLATVDTGSENTAIVWHPDGDTVVVATRVGCRTHEGVGCTVWARDG